MRGYRVPSSLIDKIEREALHIGDFSYTDGMDKVIDSIKDLGEVELDNPWHTGTPTEEGWYLLHTKETIPFRVAYMRNNQWLSVDDSRIRVDIVIEWQKIEPYRG